MIDSARREVRPESWAASVRALWTHLWLRAGSVVLLGYAAAGTLVGVEIFAMLAVWPVGVALLLMTLVGGATVRRRRRTSSEA